MADSFLTDGGEPSFFLCECSDFRRLPDLAGEDDASPTFSFASSFSGMTTGGLALNMETLRPPSRRGIVARHAE